jgi:hypothetical protein
MEMRHKGSRSVRGRLTFTHREPHVGEQHSSRDSTSDVESSATEKSIDQPITLRKGKQTAASKPMNRYGLT